MTVLGFSEEEAIKKEDIPAVYQSAIQLTKDGDTQGAKKKLESIIQADPDYVPAYHNLGTILLQEDELEKAIEYLEKAASLMPNEPNSQYMLATAYARYGEYPKAIIQYKKTIELNPSMMQPYHEMGLVYFRMGDWPHAIENLKKALELMPDSSNTMLLLGMTYLRSGKPENAIEMVLELRNQKQETKATSLENMIRAVQEMQKKVVERDAALAKQALEPDPAVLDPSIPAAAGKSKKPSHANPFSQPRRPPPAKKPVN